MNFRNHWLARYAFALMAVVAASLLRLGLTGMAGGSLPTYITFYPAVMLSALLGGVGPGLFSTAVTALGVDYFILSPQGSFAVATLPDAVGMAFFSGTGVFMSVVAELYRRARQLTAAYETDALLRDRREGPTRSGQGLLLNAGFAASLAILAAVGWESARNLRAVAKADDMETHSRVVIQELEYLVSALKDAETGQRGYLLTGEEIYLEPYEAALSQMHSKLAGVKQLTQDNARQQQRLAGLEALILEKTAELKQTIELRRSQGLPAALQVVTTDKGKALMDQVRKRVAEAEDDENRLLQDRAAAKKIEASKTLQALLAGGVLSFFLLLTVFLFLKRENICRAQAEADVRQHRDHLKEMVAARTEELNQSNGQLKNEAKEHQLAKEALRQQREWLRVTLTSIGDAVLTTDIAGLITFFNPVAESLSGWKESEVLGQPVQRVFRIVNELTLAPGEDIVARVLREQQVVTLANHTALIARDGRNIPIEDSAAPIRDGNGAICGVVLVFHDVTRKRRDQEALRASEDRYRTLFNTLIEGFCIIEVVFDAEDKAVDYRFLVVNLAFEKQTGLRNVTGKLMRDLAPEHEARWFEIYGKVALTGQPIRFESEARALNRWYDVSAYRVGGTESRKVAILFNDITERKRAEEAHARLAAIVESSDDAIISKDLRGTITSWNVGAERLFGYGPEEAIGRPISLLLPPERQEEEAPIMRRLQAGERVEHFETVRLSKDGRCLAVSVTISPLKDGRGRIIGASKIVRDITERKQKEEELQRLNRTLRALKESSQAMMRATSETEYLDEVCKSVIAHCGHAMVWIGLAEQDAVRSVRPVSHAGFEEGYIETLKISWADNDRGHGPTGTAIRTCQACTCRNMLTDPAFTPWRAHALQRGYASSIALPLLSEGKALGAITIYSRQTDAFSEDETRLLSQLADDVTYCIRSLRAVSLRQRAETQLRLLSTAVESAANGIAVTDRNGTMLWVNPAFTKLTGYSRAEVLGQNPRILKSGQQSPDFYRQMWTTLLQGQPWHGELVNRYKDGSLHAEEMTITPVEVNGAGITHFVAIKQDITGRKRAERRTELLAEMASRLLSSHDPQRAVNDLCGQVLEFLDCQVSFNFLVDEKSQRLRLNTCAGLPPSKVEKIEGLDCCFAQCGCAAHEGCRIIGRNIHESSDPRTEWVKQYGVQAYACHPLMVAGQFLGTLSFGTRSRLEFMEEELTFMKTVADLVVTAIERKRAQVVLQLTAEEVKRSNRDLEQFAYIASHDLQEPLRAVGGYVKLLQRRFPQDMDAKALEYIHGAAEGADRMERLITDLLAFSRVGPRGGAFSPVNLETVLDDALHNLQAAIHSSRAKVTRDPMPTLAADGTQMMQLLQNLIGNAIKFRSEHPPEIHVGAEKQPGRWVFAIRDNGIGIEPQYFERIFQIFQRLHTRKHYPGTGIGLAICKKIVERHDGAIWVESRLGQGATFYFSLPETSLPK